MTREEFTEKLLEKDSTWDIFNLVLQTIQENEVRDFEGNLITEDTNLAKLRFDPKKPGMPCLRVTIDVGLTSFEIDGVESLTIPTPFLCIFFSQLAHVHLRWHKEGEILLGAAAESFLGDMEKVISETLGKGFFHSN